jgi:cytoskeletal protein RodZ
VGSFGDKFRKERERRDFTLDDVSNVTKISSRMLKAIEEEQFNQLPGGVFNKGFIRAYAKHLGLNDEEAVTEYLAALRQAQIDAQNASWQIEHPSEPRVPTEPIRSLRSQSTPPAAEKTQPRAAALSPLKPATKTPPAEPAEVPERVIEEALPAAMTAEPQPEYIRSRGFPWKMPALAAVIILSGAFIWQRHSHNPRADGNVHAAVSPAVATQSSTDPGLVAKVATKSPTGFGSPSASNAADGASSLRPDSTSTPSRSASEKSAASDVSTKKLAPAPAATSPVTTPAPFTLQIRAAENSWIAVTADGQLVSQETLIAPANTSFRATREIIVRAGNAAGVSFFIGGKEIPAQGSEAEVKTYVFDRHGLRTDAQD